MFKIFKHCVEDVKAYTQSVRLLLFPFIIIILKLERNKLKRKRKMNCHALNTLERQEYDSKNKSQKQSLNHKKIKTKATCQDTSAETGSKSYPFLWLISSLLLKLQRVYDLLILLFLVDKLL